MSVNIKNKRASFEYEFLIEMTAGIELQGSEIKSIRDGKASVSEAFCYFKRRPVTKVGKDNVARTKEVTELWIKGMHIAEYKQASYNNHDPYRERKLLLNKRELKKLSDKLRDKGLTIIVKNLFIKGGWAKLNIALAKGKKLYDKRNSLKEKDTKRDLDREFKM